MTEEELARHDSKTLLQLLLSADARCDALTAERDWLRAALKAIVVGVDEDFDEATQQNVTTWFSDQDMQDIARAALKGETP